MALTPTSRRLDAATADLERVLMDRVLAGTIDDGASPLTPSKYIQEARCAARRSSSPARPPRWSASGRRVSCVDRQRLEGRPCASTSPRES